jgi:hypothetical protein
MTATRQVQISSFAAVRSSLVSNEFGADGYLYLFDAET